MSVRAVTVLFTDLVGSTSLATTVGPTVAEKLRQDHFAALRAAISEAEGEEVKNLGDGLMVAFSSVSTAVGCAKAMQQGIERHNQGSDHQLAIRVGIAHGEADSTEGDWFGPPVVEAARLCAKARGDQILVGEVTRLMAGGRGDHVFAPVGELELKGLPAPVAAFEVSWEPATVVRAPLPSRLRGVPPVAYVGRAEERGRMDALWEAARGGLRQAVMIAGEPGMGKTRLATHTALTLHEAGATVMYGHCDEDLSVPYGPWVEALSHYVDHASAEALESHVGRHGGEITRLVPGLGRRRPDFPAPTSSDPETERYLMFCSVVGLLEEACVANPTVLILDDLHWSDKPTLALLKHVLSESDGFRLFVLGTYRESDLARDHPLTHALADLRGIPGTERLSLKGLDFDEVVALMAGAAGHEIDEPGFALAQELLTETDGNPFYVAEMLRHLLESGVLAQGPDGRWEIQGELSDLGLPQSVREVIGRRVERLGERTVGLLRLAAVIGRDFEVDLLVALARETEDEVLEHLERAVAASVLVERSEPGTFTFAHALINHTLYEELGATRRARAHHRVAEALEAACDGQPGVRTAELARHWLEATTPVDGGKALAYSALAGERALDELAPDEAARWFSRALGLLDKAADDDQHRRCEVMARLGEAQRQAGDAAYRETLLAAAGIAEGLGEAEVMARAALANNRGYASSFGEVDWERVDFLERAVELDRLEHPALCAQLLARHALELQWDQDHERRHALAEEALALARDSGDDRALALVMRDYQNAVWPESSLDHHLAVSRELEALAAVQDDPLIQLAALDSVYNLATISGCLSDADRALAGSAAIIDRLRQPAFRWHGLWHEACLRLLRGELDEAEAAAQKAAEVGAAAGQADAVMMYGGQITAIRVEQGRGDEVVGLLESAARDNPGIRAFAAGVAHLLALLGRRDEAAEVVRRGAADGFACVERGPVFTTTLALYARATQIVGAADVAGRLYELLLPAREQIVSSGATAYGSVEAYLGCLAATLRRYETADEHFAAASKVHAREGMRVWEARNQVAWARSLLERDPVAARQRAERAAAFSREHGYGGAAAEAADVLAAVAAVSG